MPLRTVLARPSVARPMLADCDGTASLGATDNVRLKLPGRASPHIGLIIHFLECFLPLRLMFTL